MYLTEMLVLNNGSLRDFHLTPAFRSDGAPKPILVVGPNGSGKTNFLSIIADGLIEHAKRSFRNIVEPDPHGRRLFFRLVGGATRSVGAPFSATLLRFEHNGTSLCFRETQGKVRPPDLVARIGDRNPGLSSWDTDDPNKAVSGDTNVAKDAFERGAYCFFPSSRAELPYWLNVEGVSRAPQFDVREHIAGL